MLGTDDYHQHVKPQKINGLLYDQYGYAYENCTSYDAIQTEFDMGQPVLRLGGAGNWPANARTQKIPTDGTPRLWSYACFAPNTHGAGPKGHVALVQGINSDGTFNVSEYNFDNPLAFGERFNLSAGGVQFVHYYKSVPVPTPTPTGDEDGMFLATAGIRPATIGQDPRGQGAIYLVSGSAADPGFFKRWISGVVGASLADFEKSYGPVVENFDAFKLDRMIELPAITNDYVVATGFTTRPTATPDPSA